MKRLSIASVGVVSLLLSGPAWAGGNETKIPQSEVPKAVIEAVQKKHPKAEMTKFEKETKKGTLHYEVKVAAKSMVKEGDVEREVTRNFEVYLSPEGKILKEEERLRPDALPELVKKALEGSAYAGKTVKKAERIVKGEDEKNVRYDVVILDGTKKIDVCIDKDGKVSAEDDDDEDEDDADDDDDDDGDDEDDDEDDDD
jgi:hypothetical protein